MSKKKLLTIVTAVTLCAAMAVGATLAYLFDINDAIENNFTFGGNINTEIDEPNFPDDPPEIKPGDYVIKDPIVKNLDNSKYDVYVAMKIDFTIGEDIGYDEFLKIADLSGIGTDWTIKKATDGNLVAFYNPILAVGTNTSAVFGGVQMKQNTAEIVAILTAAGGFKIDVSSYAVTANADADYAGDKDDDGNYASCEDAFGYVAPLAGWDIFSGLTAIA